MSKRGKTIRKRKKREAEAKRAEAVEQATQAGADLIRGMLFAESPTRALMPMLELPPDKP